MSASKIGLGLAVLLSMGLMGCGARAVHPGDLGASQHREQVRSSAVEGLNAAQRHQAAMELSRQLAAAAQAHAPWVWSQFGRADNPYVELPRAYQERFAGLKWDPAPPELVLGSHYWVSNENDHELWFDTLKDIGGCMSGVGTDQLYLFAAWAKSSVLVPLDFDITVAELHRVYGVFFIEAEGIDEFMRLWSAKGEEDAVALLTAKLGSDGSQETGPELYLRSRATVYRRLKMLQKHYEKVGVSSFVTDADDYAFVRMLWLNHRVYPVRGDLTAEVAMVSLARTLEGVGLDLRVLYLSNAEKYFDYTPQFRRNIIEQPYSIESLILRTRQAEYLGVAAGGYHYNVQAAVGFAHWMERSKVANQTRLLRHKEDGEVEGFSVIRALPDGDAEPALAPAP